MPNYDDIEFMHRLGCVLLQGADAICELKEMEQERNYWKAEYDKLLSESLAHNEKMMGNILVGLLNGNIVSNKKD